MSTTEHNHRQGIVVKKTWGSTPSDRLKAARLIAARSGVRLPAI